MHDLNIKEVLDKHKTTMKGLSNKEAEERLKLYGKNEIEKAKKTVVFEVLF